MEPKEAHFSGVESIFSRYKIKSRVCNINLENNSVLGETQLRLEMTEIYPAGVVVYSGRKNDYQENLKVLINQKVKRLYDNANVTNFPEGGSMFDSQRQVHEDKSFEDLHGYENVERERNSTKHNNFKGQ